MSHRRTSSYVHFLPISTEHLRQFSLHSTKLLGLLQPKTKHELKPPYRHNIITWIKQERSLNSMWLLWAVKDGCSYTYNWIYLKENQLYMYIAQLGILWFTHMPGKVCCAFKWSQYSLTRLKSPPHPQQSGWLITCHIWIMNTEYEDCFKQDHSLLLPTL